MGDWSDYFQVIKLDGPVLPVRKTRCAECPCDGMYREVVDALLEEDDGTRMAVSERWFCHTSPRLACRGNWDAQALERAEVLRG